MYEHFKAEWTKDCNCPAEGEDERFIYKGSDNLAKAGWLAHKNNGEVYYGIHSRKSGHLLTVHASLICSCNDCTPTDNG